MSKNDIEALRSLMQKQEEFFAASIARLASRYDEINLQFKSMKVQLEKHMRVREKFLEPLEKAKDLLIPIKNLHKDVRKTHIYIKNLHVDVRKTHATIKKSDDMKPSVFGFPTLPKQFEKLLQKFLNTRIDSYEIDMSVRLTNMLRSLPCETFEDLLDLSRVELKKQRNFGKQSLLELVKIFESYGIDFNKKILC